MRVLVLGVGGPAGANVCRALLSAGHVPLGADVDPSHLVFVKDLCEVVPWDPPFTEVDANVVMAQPDPLALWLSDSRESITQAIFMPSRQTVALCQDKFETGLAWRRSKLRDGEIRLIDSEESMADAIAALDFPMWVRARHGAGAKAAICARSYWELKHWFLFWRRRSDWSMEFVAEKFLPGRDYSWCGIYREGKFVVGFARERLEYIYPHLTPEGLTGTPTRATVISEFTTHWEAHAAVVAVDQAPHGVYCVDLRDDEDGNARPTEINAGRFSTTVGLWSTYSEHSNFVALAAELAVGDLTRLETWEPLPTGLTLNRHIDCGHSFTLAKVLA